MVLKAIKKWLNFGWEELTFKQVPKWIRKRKGRFWKGNYFLYKLEKGKYYRKNRGLEYPEGIPKNKQNKIRWQYNNQVIYTPRDFRNPFEP